MIGLKDIHIDTATRERFVAASNDLSARERERLEESLPKAVDKARKVAGHWEFGAPAQAIDSIFKDNGKSSSDSSRLRRAAIGHLALRFFSVEDRLPASVMELYPEFFARLSRFIAERLDELYDEDYYAKDVRYALGLTVPCGALQIDLRYRVGPRLLLRDATAFKRLGPSVAYMRAGPWRRWYNDHLDPRAMKEFNPKGWTSCFARIADILELNPEVAGVTGISWFYDPKVAEISPRLSYVRKTPERHGAFLANMGTAPHHVANATYKSPTRRRLYEEGSYVPTCYLIAWPRRPLIGWARRLKMDPSIGFEADDPDVAMKRSA
jgi:hypothetical protein